MEDGEESELRDEREEDIEEEVVGEDEEEGGRAKP